MNSPNELLVDPIGLAREHHLPEDDFLLAYPYEEKRVATVTELSEVIQQQAARQRSR